MRSSANIAPADLGAPLGAPNKYLATCASRLFTTVVHTDAPRIPNPKLFKRHQACAASTHKIESSAQPGKREEGTDIKQLNARFNLEDADS